jgi:hypothetical protein
MDQLKPHAKITHSALEKARISVRTRLGTHRFQRADFGRKSFGKQENSSPCLHAGSDAYPGVSSLFQRIAARF